jgi:Zn-dependent oligopeptidase
MEIGLFIKSIVIPLLISGGTAYVILKFLSKKIIEQQLRKDIENHIQVLTEKTENLKHTLSIFAHESNIKATRVDVQLSNAIHKIYSEFVKLFYYAEIFANQKPPKVDIYAEMTEQDSQESCNYTFYKENAEKIEKYSDSLRVSLLSNAIYIDPKTYNIIYGIQQKFSKLSNDFLEGLREEEEPMNDVKEIATELSKLKNNLIYCYKDELSNSFEVIISIFRKQLGII